MILLVPADVLVQRRPDEMFAAEADAARAAGLPVALVDHDLLTQSGDAGRAVARVPEGQQDAVYRGWMVRAGQYEALAGALAARGVTLRTSPGQYQRAHELPGWYPAFSGLTPDSAWTRGDDRAAFDQARAELGSSGQAVIRDYVKSMKHYWDTAMYVPDLADAGAAWQVASQFRALREDEFTGGFVLRRFEPFTGGEARTWWVSGECALVTPHPDTSQSAPPGSGDLPLTEIAQRVRTLGLAFATVDLALRADGTWRVVEVGDGQVSGFPATSPASDLVAAIWPSLARRQAEIPRRWYRPDKRLGHDHLRAVERHGGALVQLVSECHGLADSVAEGRVIGSGQHPVPGQSIRRLTHARTISNRLEKRGTPAACSAD